MSFFRWILPAVLTLSAASAQGPVSAIDVANLKEDVRGLTQKLGEVTLRLEQLERENTNLRSQIVATGETKVTLNQLNQALADQKRTGRKLGRVFVESGFVTEEQISGALARQLGIPYINLKFYNINQDVVRLLPETQARRFRALVLAGGASWFISSSYQAQMPAYAHDIGHADPGFTYSLLLAADALGALCAGLLWEYWGQRSPASTRKAMVFALVWAVSMALFAMADRYAIAVVLLFVAGFAELTSNATAQTIVQTSAPLHIRGRVIGLFNMAALGLRFGSGLMVGVMGGWLGIHGSLVAACLSFVAFLLFLQLHFKKGHVS